MKPVEAAARERRRTVIDAAVVFVVIVLMVQMWLLTAALEAHLAGHDEATLPAMLASLVLFASCAAMYRFVARVDRESR